MLFSIALDHGSGIIDAHTYIRQIKNRIFLPFHYSAAANLFLYYTTALHQGHWRFFALIHAIFQQF